MAEASSTKILIPNRTCSCHRAVWIRTYSHDADYYDGEDTIMGTPMRLMREMRFIVMRLLLAVK